MLGPLPPNMGGVKGGTPPPSFYTCFDSRFDAHFDSHVDSCFGSSCWFMQADMIWDPNRVNPNHVQFSQSSWISETSSFPAHFQQSISARTLFPSISVIPGALIPIAVLLVCSRDHQF